MRRISRARTPRPDKDDAERTKKSIPHRGVLLRLMFLNTVINGSTVHVRKNKYSCLYTHACTVEDPPPPPPHRLVTQSQTALKMPRMYAHMQGPAAITGISKQHITLSPAPRTDPRDAHTHLHIIHCADRRPRP